MPSEANDATKAADGMLTLEYVLSCSDCSFRTTVEGSFLDALDIADKHQEEHGDAPRDHFVNVEHTDSQQP